MIQSEEDYTQSEQGDELDENDKEVHTKYPPFENYKNCTGTDAQQGDHEVCNEPS